MSSARRQYAALVVIDGGLGWSEVVCRTRLYFDKAEHWSMPRDQVDITGHVA